MAKVLFTVAYEIPDSSRGHYLELVSQLKPLLNTNGTTYSVYEVEHKRNFFQEVYIYPSAEAYEAAEDIENPQADTLIQQIYELAKEHKVTYSTVLEVI